MILLLARVVKVRDTANAGSVRPSVRPSVCHTHDC